MPAFRYIQVTNSLSPDTKVGEDLPIYALIWFLDPDNKDNDRLQQVGDAPISIGKSASYDLKAYEGKSVSVGACITSNLNGGDGYVLHSAFNNFEVAIEDSGDNVGLFSIQGTYQKLEVEYDGEK